MNFKKKYEKATGYTPICKIGECSLKKLEFGIIELSAGETVELLVPGKIGHKFTATTIYNDNGDEIPSVPHPQMHFSIDVPFPVPEHSVLRYAREETEN